MIGRAASVLLLTVVASGVLANTAVGARTESRVFFAGNRSGAWQVYSVRRVGSGLAQLTELPGSRAPVPSPNGKLVVFRRDGEAKSDLWVMGADGRGARFLTALGARPRAVWSPDSRRIAVNDAVGIRIIDVQTRRSRSISRPGVAPLGWSRDGSVLFAHVQSGCSPACSLVAITVATGVERQLVQDASEPALSPNGRSIAYFSARGDLRIEDGPGDRLVAADLSPAPLRWSPRGRYLAFANGRVTDPLGALSAGVLVADTAAASVTTLTEEPIVRAVPAFAPAVWGAPAWSPSGDAVAFAGVGGLRMFTVGGRVHTLFDTTRDGSVVADVAWAQTPRLVRPRQAGESQGLVQMTGEELRFRAGIPSELAADGGRVAFLSCNNPGVWTPSTQNVAWVGPNTCPRAQASIWNLGNIALSSVGTAFVAWSGGGNSQSFSLLVHRPGGAISESVGSGYLCCTGGPRSGSEVGAALGSGPLLVFSSWTVRCPGFNDVACAVSSGPQSVWRVREAGTAGSCPNTAASTFTGPCTPLVASAGPIVPLSVDGERALVRLEGGRLDVLDREGGLVRSFGFAPGEATAAEFDRDDVVVTIDGVLLHYSLGTGALLHAWPLPHVSSGGFCGAPVRAQCAQVRLRLEDVRAGLVAYLLDGSLHVLRLSNGVDSVVDQATTARFGDSGLFYAREGEPPWPGRIRFRPLATVAPLVGFGSLSRPGKL